MYRKDLSSQTHQNEFFPPFSDGLFRTGVIKAIICTTKTWMGEVQWIIYPLQMF